MGLTVTEKEHWKERIERRINKRIESVWASDPNLKERIDKEARQKALESLKLAELEQECDQIEEQRKQLEARDQQLARQKLAIIRGVPVDTIENNFSYHADQEIEQLQDERENLLDTIWLATSPAQLKTLWTKVTELLHENATPLEKEALAIPP